MARARATMNEKHSARIARRAEQIQNRKRNNELRFAEVTDWANNTFGTRYSIFQVSACLGRAGFRQG